MIGVLLRYEGEAEDAECHSGDGASKGLAKVLNASLGTQAIQNTCLVQRSMVEHNELLKASFDGLPSFRPGLQKQFLHSYGPE